MVDAEDPTEGVRAWALWRQSGHKGREWLTENVVVPSMPGVTKYKWNHAPFGIRGISKRMGSNPGHGPSEGGASLLGVTVP
ncbi:hypothetical protein E2C01_006827 [Portunus trituberculatus]|uniref:Uncharacterized protein n=1 Tax=Portunus trituberculatus TaxID=210409 RepID=A0A5B7CYD3_PORTR|nr:hypothetical protein [Portunus trituberculatus]